MGKRNQAKMVVAETTKGNHYMFRSMIVARSDNRHISLKPGLLVAYALVTQVRLILIIIRHRLCKLLTEYGLANLFNRILVNTFTVLKTC